VTGRSNPAPRAKFGRMHSGQRCLEKERSVTICRTGQFPKSTSARETSGNSRPSRSEMKSGTTTHRGMTSTGQRAVSHFPPTRLELRREKVGAGLLALDDPPLSRNFLFVSKNGSYCTPIQIHFLADSVAGQGFVTPRRSREICAEERAKKKYFIVRREYYIECSCGYKGPALDGACRDCGTWELSPDLMMKEDS